MAQNSRERTLLLDRARACERALDLKS